MNNNKVIKKIKNKVIKNSKKKKEHLNDPLVRKESSLMVYIWSCEKAVEYLH